MEKGCWATLIAYAAERMCDNCYVYIQGVIYDILLLMCKWICKPQNVVREKQSHCFLMKGSTGGHTYTCIGLGFLRRNSVANIVD